MDAFVVNSHFSKKSRREKIIRTITLTIGWICMGLFTSIPGATLIDLKLRIGVNYDEISEALAGQDVGYLIGAALGGLLTDRFTAWCNLLVAVPLTVAAIATLCVPFATVIRVLWACIFFNGTSIGFMDVAGQKLALMIWQEKSTAPLNIIHSGFGIGGFITPLIANPFLAILKNVATPNVSELVTEPNTQDSTFIELPINLIRNATDTENKTSTYKIEFVRESTIEIAYIITASVILATSLIFYRYHYNDINSIKLQRRSERESENDKHSTKPLSQLRDIFNPATCADGNFVYGSVVLLFIFMFYFNLVGTERVIGMFVRAFSIDQLGFSVYSGSYLNTAFWIGFSVGRLLGSFAPRWVPIRILILANAAGILVSSILLIIFARNNSIAFWILITLLGLLMGPAFPYGIGWGNYHIQLTGMVLCLLTFGSAFGGMGYIRLAGYLFETYGPWTFLYHLLGFGITAFVLTAILDVIGAKHGTRYKKEMTSTGDTALEVLGENSENK